MINKRKTYLVVFLCIGICMAVAGYGIVTSSLGAPGVDVKQETFAQLKLLRDSKRDEIIDHFQQVRELAQTIKDDELMRGSFAALRQGKTSFGLEYAVDERYATNYGDFYDILFVDSTGYVFHSIKKERDYHSNLFTSPATNSELAKALKRPDEENFVEFNYYRPSEEPAAFFTVSLQENGNHLGWFVLQVSTNNTNQILADHKTMGRTGEVYLVNRNSLMLSDSRFMEDSTILRQKVDTIAVREALRKQAGDRVIEDYRGVKVFSSYESFDVFGVSWIIIAEIDEDEVLTEFYTKHKKYFQKEFIRYLAQTSRPEIEKRQEEVARQRVDMNEFSKGQTGKLLTTHGVASCTAVAIYYPGKFSYLAHISPTAEIYQDSALNKFFLGRHYHNFLAELLGRIEYFEVIPAQRRMLRVAIVAPHTQSFAKAVDAVLAHDIELANITFIYDPQALRADVLINASGSRLDVQWAEEHRVLTVDGLKTENLSDILKKIIHYDA